MNSTHHMALFSTFMAFLVAGQLFCVMAASAFQTSAPTAIIVDHGTGLVLYEKNADQPMPPASMSKLMTVYMVFEALESGRITLDDELPVSTHAVKSVRGSTMFLDTRDRVRVEDLLRGIIVLSGNDACIVLAEALSPDGTEAGFARMMNERARELGLKDSYFVNASGWPHPDHIMSVRDLSVLARLLIRNFPVRYAYFAETEFRFDNRAPENRYNRNPLLRREVPGADGLKTGYTSGSKYGIVGSAIIGNSRVVFVLNGLPSRGVRADEAEGIVGWYQRNFSHREVVREGEVVLDAPVWLGTSDTVPVVTDRTVSLPIPVNFDGDVMIRARFDNVIEAPVAKGEQVGSLHIEVVDLDMEINVPLLTAESVDEGGISKRVTTAAKLLLDRYVLDLIPKIL